MAAYEEQEYKKPFQMKVWAKMFPFFKPYRKYFMITLGLNIFLAGVDVLTPLFQSYAIDHFIVPNTLQGNRSVCSGLCGNDRDADGVGVLVGSRGYYD